MTYQLADFGGGLQDAWSNIARWIPKFIAFLVILIIGYIVAKVIAKILTKILQKVGFDRLVERGGIKSVLAKSSYDASAILAKVVFYAIMLFVLSTAFGVFGPNPINDYLHAIIAYLPLVFVAIVIMVIAAAVAAGVRTLIVNTLGGLSYGNALANVAAAVVIALGLIAALNQLHIAENVVNAVLYAALAIIVGVAIVAGGGGGIKPMAARWEKTLTKYDEEKPKMAQAAQNASSVKEQAQQAKQQAQNAGNSSGQPPAQGRPQPGSYEI